MSFVSAALAKYRHLMPIYETDKDQVSAVLHMIAVFKSAPPGDDAALLGAYLDDLNKIYPVGAVVRYRGSVTSAF